MNLSKRERIFIRVIFAITFIELAGAVLGAILDADDRKYYLFTAFACFGMMALIFVPAFTRKLFKVMIPSSLYVVFVIFCFCAIILGDVKDFFGTFKYWDAVLHFSSGMMLAVFGFILVNTLNHTKSDSIRMSPFFVAAVAFCFVMTVQSLWEICEFLSDEWFGLNTQTYMLTTTGSYVQPGDIPLEGHEALRDTISDFMLDGIGGLIISIIGYFNLKKGKAGFTTASLDKTE